MGWQSGNDPMDHVILRFKTKEAAIYHCETNGTGFLSFFLGSCSWCSLGYNYHVEDTEHKWAAEGRAYGTKFNHKPPKKSDSDLL